MNMVWRFSLHMLFYNYSHLCILVKQLLVVSFREENRLYCSSGLIIVAISFKGRNVEKHHHMNWWLHCYLFSVLYGSVTFYCCSRYCENLEKDNEKARKCKSTLTLQKDDQQKYTAETWLKLFIYVIAVSVKSTSRKQREWEIIQFEGKK